MTLDLAAKEAAARAARGQVTATAHELIYALTPSTIVREGIDGAKQRVAVAAENAADFAKTRPVGTGAVLGSAAGFVIWRVIAAFRRNPHDDEALASQPLNERNR